jgi:drug/metabolite transporter (DMT)-like permease
MGSRLLRPVETAILSALETPLAPVWVWLAFTEAPSLATVIGGTIVVAAVVAHVVLSAKAA